MKISLTAIACCAAIASASPTGNFSKPIPSSTPQYNKYEILNFMLNLEHFQDAFYRQGLANFTRAQFATDGFDADFYTNLKAIASQEHTHVTSLTSTLLLANVTPVAECNYFFNVSNPTEFVTDASLIAAVSVSSYIDLLSRLRDPAYLKVYSSVLAVEARHSSFLRGALGDQPFPSPYDTPIDLDETYTLVQLYTLSCPEANPLALKNYPTLSSSFTNHGMIGREIILLTYGKDIKANSDDEPICATFLTLTGPIFSPAIRLPMNAGFNTTVPAPVQGYAPLNGLTYVVMSSSNTSLTDDTILAGPATIEIYLQ
ncbi:MAG: hypothetical protein M1812_002951 [Candelaria pacifica]|nr:MAG: hypothetical protein M1812_002951 [Candelaria pacifica]